jgi:phosphoglycerate dehydrogenase-like enzyme
VPDKIRIAITFKLSPGLVQQIEAVDPRIEVVEFPVAVLRPDIASSDDDVARAKAALADVDIIFGPNTIDREFVEAAPKLKWFQVINAGVDRMAEQGLLGGAFVVTNVSGLAAVAIAEYVIGTMLMLCKGLHTSVRDQAAHKWNFRFTAELKGSTVGIAGMGAIGRETARRARAFGMRVVASRRSVAPGQRDDDCDLLVPYSELDTLLAESDYLVLCVPLTVETTGLIGAAELAKMKPTASIINIARGAVVDQPALIQALKDGTIAGAALDVTEPEPLPAESELWDLPNVIITPHISGAVQSYGTRATEIFLRNLRHFVAGEPLENVVDPQLAY